MNKFLILIFFSINASAQLAGSIPLDFGNRPATDLIYKNKKLLPSEAKNLHLKGKDLSDLLPEESDIWKNKKNNLDLFDDRLVSEQNLKQGLKYQDKVPSRLENFRFTVKNTKNGITKFYTILISKNSHQFLLRKNLLRSIGYIVPNIQYIKKFKLKFNGEFSKKIFLDNLGSQTFGDPKRWVIENNKSDSSLLIQDVLLFSSNEPIYNLAMGFIPGQIIKGRRVLNALSLPYSMVNTRESINGLSWLAGKVFNNRIILNIDNAEEFSTTYHDAKWILKRIKNLGRKEIEKIVKYAYFPKEVEILLIEKLISRRNSLLDHFDLLKNDKMNYNPSISSGKHLKEGVLLKEWYEGHGSRYAYNPSDSPLSSSEIKAFFKSKVIGNMLSSAVYAFNEKFVPKTDIQGTLIEKQQELAEDQFIKFLETGELQEIPFGVYAFPTLRGNVDISRQVFAGSYLGTDNVIQLADSLTLNVAAGFFAGLYGLPINWQGAISGEGSLSRTYTHLKPIRSIKKALKEPYKNILVNLLKRKKGKIFNTFLTPEFQELSKNERQKVIDETFKIFNENLEVGESLIITDSINRNIDFTAGYSFTDIFRLQGNLFANKLNMSRLHILRATKDTIHIYRDKGNLKLKGLSFGVDAYIPVLKFIFTASKGQGETNFFKLNMNTEENENPSVVKNALALRQVLIENNLELLKIDQNPYRITHDFKEKAKQFDFLFFRSLELKQNDQIKVIHPTGFEKKFHRYQDGKRRGKDYQGLTIDVLNSILEEELDSEFLIDNSGSGDPGDTFRGNSRSRISSMEIEEKGKRIVEPFLDINYRWKGWKIKRRKINKIIKEIHSKFGEILFPEEVLHNTNYLELYSIDVNVYLYKDAIETYMNIADDELLDFLKENARIPKIRRKQGESSTAYKKRIERRRNAINRKAVKFLNEFKLYFEINDFNKYTKFGQKFVGTLETILPFEKFIELTGGRNNMFLQGRITGFRGPDENGDQPIFSNSIGEFGSIKPRGSLRSLQRKIGITESEFFLYWLLRRI